MPLDGVERITIDGTEYEAFNTSGGVATMCQTFAGKVGDLNYKTMRYPGHRDLMKFLLQDLNLAPRQELVTQIFDQEVPLTESDVVVFYVSVVGNEAGGGLKQRSFIKKMHGDTIHAASSTPSSSPPPPASWRCSNSSRRRNSARVSCAGIRLAGELPLHPVGRTRLRQINPLILTQRSQRA